ncbi:MAG: HEAT repeat domain-containing protein [Planctomycetota bacterium]
MVRTLMTVIVAFGFAADLAAAREQAYTRRYESGGLKIEAGFVPDKTEIAAGEPMFIAFSVTNLGDADVGLPVMSERAERSTSFSVTAVNAGGHKVKDPLEKNDSHGGRRSLGALAAGESATYRLFLPQWLVIGWEGTYTVSCQTTLQLIKPDAEGRLTVGTRNTVDFSVSADFELDVVARDAVKAAEIIDRFGQGVSSDDWTVFREAIVALSAIDDERVIPYLLTAVGRTDLSRLDTGGWRRIWTERAIKRSYPHGAITALGRFRNVEAVDALMAVLKNAEGDPSARSTAAAALASTKCRLALPALLDALDANDIYLQEAATNALAEIGDRSAVDRLRSRLSTPDMRVRLAVVKALLTLGEPFNEDWVKPVIMSKSGNEFNSAVWFVRRHAGWDAPRILVECLDSGDASAKSYYNYTLVWQIAACGGPALTYNHDFDGKATDRQLAENQRTLDALKAWLAGQKAPH